MSELNNIPVTLEDAWKQAKEQGYEGTCEEFAALCDKIEEKMSSEKLDLAGMESVAGGSFKSAMEAVGDWCKENTGLLAGIGGAVATLAGGYAAYRYFSGGNTGTGGTADFGRSSGFSTNTLDMSGL